MASQQSPRDDHDDGSTAWHGGDIDANYTWEQPMADFSPSDINDFLGQRPKRAIDHAPWNQDATVPRSPQLPYQSWPSQQRHEYEVARTEPILGHSLRGGSVITDSGYGSLVPTSGPQNYPPCFPLPSPPTQQVHFQPPPPPESISTEPARLQPQFSPPGPPSSSSRISIPPCPDCGKLLKNKSDANKHKLQHDRPHQCNELGCKRLQGFATKNDLERHRKTVHHKAPRVGVKNGFICAACPDPTPEAVKFWPRRDNFKAHIKRRHPLVDAECLIQRSEAPRPADAISESGYGSAAPQSRLDPMDAGDQDLPNSMDLGIPNDAFQPAEYAFGFGDGSQNDELAGVGGGPLTDPGTDQESGLHASSWSNSQFALPAVLITSSGGDDEYSKQWATPDQYSHLSIPLSAGGSTSTSTRSSDQGEFRCIHCAKRKKRECDLRKHMKRHTRPYGCTFPRCSKRFGSRNDWKRHENSQHFQLEAWRCSLPQPDGRACGRLVSKIEHMRQHLEGPKHAMYPASALLEEMHIGRNGYANFWCGFCNKLISTKDNLQACEARLKHIGDHYDKEECDIEDWVCVEENRPKRSIVKRGKKPTTQRARRGGIQLEDDSDLGEDGIPASVTPGYVGSVPGKRRRAEDVDSDANNIVW